VYSWQKYDVFVLSAIPTVLHDIFHTPMASVTRYSLAVLTVLLNTNQLTNSCQKKTLALSEVTVHDVGDSDLCDCLIRS